MKIKQKIIFLTLFAVAFAFLVAAAIYFLRNSYIPEHFAFTLTRLEGKPIIIEFIREICSLMILFTFAHLTGRNARDKLAFSMLVFGLWDIFYYIWLYVIAGWPPSLLHWDVLFIVPVPWTGPVLAPLLVSLALVSSALVI